jgi:hypothetical protein
MERPIFSWKDYTEEEGYIRFVRGLEEYCDSLEETIDCLKGFNHEQEQRIIVLLNSNKELKKSDDILTALESAGVDNWEGYEDAMSAFDNE